MRIMQQWILVSVMHSAVVFGVPTAIQLSTGGVWGNPAGAGDGLWYYGLQVYTCLIIAMLWTSSYMTCTWTAWTHFFLWGSLALYGVFTTVYSSLEFSEFLWNVAVEAFASKALFLAFPLIVVTMACLRALTGGIQLAFAHLTQPRVWPGAR